MVGSTPELTAYLDGDLLPHSEAVAGIRSDGSGSGGGLYDAERTFDGRVLQAQRAPTAPVKESGGRPCRPRAHYRRDGGRYPQRHRCQPRVASTWRRICSRPGGQYWPIVVQRCTGGRRTHILTGSGFLRLRTLVFRRSPSLYPCNLRPSRAPPNKRPASARR